MLDLVSRRDLDRGAVTGKEPLGNFLTGLTDWLTLSLQLSDLLFGTSYY